MINKRPLETVQNLLNTFPNHPMLRDRHVERSTPIGIEIEVPWRAYFPDLWVDGFPNLDEGQMFMIWLECREREKILLPKLQQTVDCGIPKGADRYWEFAFDPVTDVSIVCNQVAILRANGLLPEGQHSLHITLGGLRVDQHIGYCAMALESLACDDKRVMSGFHPSGQLSKGWARKGYAGTFEKEGDHDVQHGFNIAAEIRLLFLPNTVDKLFQLLDTAQILGTIVARVQRGEVVPHWTNFLLELKSILHKYGLPSRNWRKPHHEPEIWRMFAERLSQIQPDVREALAALISTENVQQSRSDHYRTS